MTYAELKAAILKVKAAVESRDKGAAFVAAFDLFRLAGDFFGLTTFAADPSGKADLAACVDDLKVACEKADATPALAAGPWAGFVFEIIKLIIDKVKK